MKIYIYTKSIAIFFGHDFPTRDVELECTQNKLCSEFGFRLRLKSKTEFSLRLKMVISPVLDLSRDRLKSRSRLKFRILFNFQAWNDSVQYCCRLHLWDGGQSGKKYKIIFEKVVFRVGIVCQGLFRGVFSVGCPPGFSIS